jgi:hypothetical protein
MIDREFTWPKIAATLRISISSWVAKRMMEALTIPTKISPAKMNVARAAVRGSASESDGRVARRRHPANPRLTS